MKSIRATCLLSTGLLVAGLPAYSQWYVGASAGESRANSGGSNQAEALLDLGFDSASTTGDDKDAAYRLHGGYRWNRWVAFELGYTDLGRYSLSTTVLPAGRLDNRVKISGFDASVIGMLPLGERFALFGRVGAFAARTRASFSGSGSVQIFDGAGESTRRTTSALYGAGLTYDFTQNLGLRAEYTRYRRVGDDQTGQYQPHTVTAGIQYRF